MKLIDKFTAETTVEGKSGEYPVTISFDYQPFEPEIPEGPSVPERVTITSTRGWRGWKDAIDSPQEDEWCAEILELMRGNDGQSIF